MPELWIQADARGTVLTHLPRRGTGVEIGVHLGGFSARILQQARPRLLHLVDPWRRAEDPGYAEAMYGGGVTQEEMDRRHDAVLRRFAAPIASGVVQVHRATSIEAAAAFAPDSLDFVYLDGDHSYDGVRQDLALYAPRVREGGVLCGDD
jgi:hypothetical protein